MPLIKRHHATLRGYVHDWLEPDEDGGFNFFAACIVTLVIVSLSALALETEAARPDTPMDPKWAPILDKANFVVLWIFTIEFALRFWSEGENPNHKGFLGRLKFLTNNFTLPAVTIAQIYKCRWQVELFFKWIKQHLRIKAFYGTSENAVKTQIWIAVSVYVLVAIVRKRLGVEASLYQILQILSVTLFEKTPILQALQTSDSNNDLLDSGNQLILFDF